MGCSGDCDSWVFDCRPLTSRHNRRVNSRNPKTEARELGKLKNPPIVCVWRHYDKPMPKWRKGLNKWIDRRRRPAQWKADLHAFTLSLLPTVVAVHALLAWNGAIGTTFWISMVLYTIMVFMVLFFKGLSRKVADNKKALNRLGFGLLALALFAFHPALPKILCSDPVDEAVVTLIGAAIIAFISQKFLALDPDYLAEAEKAPPLPRECWIRRYALCNFVLASLFAFSIILYHLGDSYTVSFDQCRACGQLPLSEFQRPPTLVPGQAARL